MADIQYWDDELSAALENLRKDVRSLNSIKVALAKTTKIQLCEHAADEIKNMKKTFKFELRQLKQKEQDVYKQKLSGYEKEIMQLMQEIKWAKTEDEKSNLMKGAKGMSKDLEVGKDEMLKGALAVQAKTKNVAERILVEIEDTKNVGGAIVEDLDAQTKTIKDVTDNVNKMEDDMKRQICSLEHS